MDERVEALVRQTYRKRARELMDYADKLGFPAQKLYLLLSVSGVDVLNREFERDGREDLIRLTKKVLKKVDGSAPKKHGLH